MKERFKNKFLIIFFLILYSHFLFSQSENIDENQSLEGVWENEDRFIEIVKGASDYEKMRIILKPYYRFTYKDEGTFDINVKFTDFSNMNGILAINYPLVKTEHTIPFYIKNNSIFTSYYERFPFYENGIEHGVNFLNDAPLSGFWIEKGSPKGILLYPQDSENVLQAFFFNGKDYIRFKYWLIDLEYTKERVRVQGNDGFLYEFPRLIKRGEKVYSCVTTKGRILRNYEAGNYEIVKDKKGNLVINFKVLGAGPGTHAVSSCYFDEQISIRENIRLTIMNDNNAFALGKAFLFRSSVLSVDEEIKKHNAKKRPARHK